MRTTRDETAGKIKSRQRRCGRQCAAKFFKLLFRSGDPLFNSVEERNVDLAWESTRKPGLENAGIRGHFEVKHSSRDFGIGLLTVAASSRKEGPKSTCLMASFGKGMAAEGGRGGWLLRTTISGEPLKALPARRHSRARLWRLTT